MNLYYQIIMFELLITNKIWKYLIKSGIKLDIKIGK
jgi:hypothetical protein